MKNPGETYIAPAYEALNVHLSNNIKEDGPGAAILITQDGQTLLRKGYGLANLEWQIPVSTETVFRIGSVTKQFTAVLTLMLMEQGKLSLQDPIEKFVPDYPTHGHLITVEHLLTHTSGIKSYTDMKSWPADWGKNFSLDELISYFKYQPMNFAPGQKWSYSNSGYILLGAIIEKCTGITYSQFLQESICEPLGMKSTWLELPGLIIPRRAEGYSKGAKGYQTAAHINMTQPLAAGGIVSTVGDLALWDAALYRGKLITAENLHRAHTPINLPDGSSTHYGYGWGIHAFEGLEVIDHAGGIHGFVCHVLRFPSKRIFAAMLTNSDTPSQSPENATFRGALLALGSTFREPEKVGLLEEEALKFVGKYEMESGAALTISINNGDLWMMWPGEDNPDKLITTGKNEFVISINPLGKYILLPDETGTQLLIEARNQYNEVKFKAKKIES